MTNGVEKKGWLPDRKTAAAVLLVFSGAVGAQTPDAECNVVCAAQEGKASLLKQLYPQAIPQIKKIAIQAAVGACNTKSMQTFEDMGIRLREQKTISGNPLISRAREEKCSPEVVSMLQ